MTSKLLKLADDEIKLILEKELRLINPKQQVTQSMILAFRIGRKYK